MNQESHLSVNRRLGAGHGGYGGASEPDSRGGDAYGSLYTPRHAGSGGGNGNVS